MSVKVHLLTFKTVGWPKKTQLKVHLLAFLWSFQLRLFCFFSHEYLIWQQQKKTFSRSLKQISWSCQVDGVEEVQSSGEEDHEMLG